MISRVSIGMQAWERNVSQIYNHPPQGKEGQFFIDNADGNIKFIFVRIHG